MREDPQTQAPKKTVPLSTRLFPWSFLIFGGVLVLFGLLGLLFSLASTSWPVAEGTITSSEVEGRTGSGSGSPSSHSTTYHAKVRYQFTVDGKSHNGGRVSFGLRWSNATRAGDTVTRYPVGAKVKVSYKSGVPGKSVLEPGIKVQDLNVPALGMLLTLAGVAIRIYLRKAALKAAKRREEAMELDP